MPETMETITALPKKLADLVDMQADVEATMLEIRGEDGDEDAEAHRRGGWIDFQP